MSQQKRIYSYFEMGETEKIEYKQSLQVSGEAMSKTYLKTICGLANNKGGVIVYGVTPNEYEIVGIADKFENLDNRYFSTTFADGIDGSFDFHFFTHRFDIKLLGFLVVKEATSKPVILKTNFDNLGEKGTAGDIYFRNSGRTSRISYADLRTLINNEVKSQVNKFLNKVEYIATQGQENVALLNTQSGELNTENTSARFLLSKEILQDINLIQEGKLVQSDGAPAYIIKGVVELASEKVVEKKVVIHTGDIFTAFYKQSCDEPLEYLKELLYKDSPYYPLYFYISAANLTKEQAIEFILQQTEQDIKKSTKGKIISRLSGQVKFPKAGKVFKDFDFRNYAFENLKDDFSSIATELKITGNARVVSVARSATFYFLKEHIDIPKAIFRKHPKEIAEAFTHLTSTEFKSNPEYYLKSLSLLHKEIRHTDTAAKTFFRKAVCQCDEALHG